MKNKSGAVMTKIVLGIVFLCGIFMMCNIFMMNEETEWMEGTVEHTYMSGAANGTRVGGSIAEVPMCRVVWYDKDGEKVVYGMPNDRDYEVGDSYFFEADAETNHFPAKKKGEYIVSFIIGIIVCIVAVLIWVCKFGKRKEKKTAAVIDPMDRKRREAYNPAEYTAVIKASICNGEQVAGFKNKKTGKFQEVMLIQSEKDLNEFKKRYGVEEVVKEY